MRLTRKHVGMMAEIRRLFWEEGTVAAMITRVQRYPTHRYVRLEDDAGNVYGRNESDILRVWHAPPAEGGLTG